MHVLAREVAEEGGWRLGELLVGRHRPVLELKDLGQSRFSLGLPWLFQVVGETVEDEDLFTAVFAAA